MKMSKIGHNSMTKWPFFAIILPWMARYWSKTSFLLIFSARDDLVKVSWKSDARKYQNQLTPPYFDQLSERHQLLSWNLPFFWYPLLPLNEHLHSSLLSLAGVTGLQKPNVQWCNVADMWCKTFHELHDLTVGKKLSQPSTVTHSACLIKRHLLRF